MFDSDGCGKLVQIKMTQGISNNICKNEQDQVAKAYVEVMFIIRMMKLLKSTWRQW